jgi:hypothetical protein
VALLAGVACGELIRLAGLWKLAIDAAPAAPQATSGQRKKSPPAPEPERRKLRFAPLTIPASLLVALAIIWPIGSRADYYFNWPPLFACRVIYNGNPFLECPQIAELLKRQTKPDDTIAVIGSEPEIYFDAERKSATGYIYTYALVEEQPLAPRMQQEMIDEIEAKKPKFIVFANVRYSWLVHPKAPTKIFEWATRYLPANYKVVGLLEPKDMLHTESFWGEKINDFKLNPDAKEWKLPFFTDRPYIFVFSRKDSTP